MSTLPSVELGVLGPLQVRKDGAPVTIPGAKPRAVLTMLGLHVNSVVSAETMLELLWGDDPPRTAVKALQTHISSLRRALGDGAVVTEGAGWILAECDVDASRYKMAARTGRDAAAAGDTSGAVARFEEALTLWRGTPELPDGRRGVSEKTRWIEGHAAVVEDRADALLATGRAAEIIGELEAAVADAPLRERRWGQLMLALYRAGRQGEALGAYQRARSLLADELGVDPGPDLRRLELAIVAQDGALDIPVSQHLPSVTRAVTFLLTDIEGSTAAWEADADAMALALARHDEIVAKVVTFRGGRLIKTRGEGDATFSVFDRPSAAAAAAIDLQDAIVHEPWALREPMRIRVALHTGEVELRDGDYFGRAVNRAARLRSVAAGGQTLCSGATAELVIDSLPDDVVLADLGTRQLKNLARPEHVFELRLQTADEERQALASDEPIERPELPAVLAGHGPFVGRGSELERLLSAWQTALAGGTHAVLIAGEPGVGKTRLAGEWSRLAYEQGAVVLYGRCDEDLGAPYQPFAEALRSIVPSLGTSRLRGLRGVEALLPLVPGLIDVLPDVAAPTRADPDTERYALFDAVVALLGVASTSASVVLILDDLHWAAKPTLLLLRHLLRFGEHARVQIVGTYRSTDLDRSHPLAAMLADLHRDGSAHRLALGGLDEGDVTAYVAEAGYDDEELARALASVTGGNPFFLIEALRHVDESGGRWDPSTLPQGVREAVSRRLSRLPAETNKALAAAAVVGSRFALALVESVVGEDLIDAFDEASKAGIVIEEPGGRYRFNHAIVRQSLLAELASVRRMRLHQKIAAALEAEPGSDDELLAELAYHYFECAWAGNAVKALEYCRRAADQANARLAYEGAADLYDKALHALDELDDQLPDRDDQQAELLIARCEALLAAGDVISATGAVAQLQRAAGDSGRLAAWGTCFDGQLSMLTDPERLDEIESAVGAAAEKLAGLDDAAGEAKAHTVRAGCLARLGRIGDAETALDQALTAARRAREHRRVNAVLANGPLAALWGPNPVPRAGGRCLDVVRLLRITTGSPVVEATSLRCQGVLDAFRGRAAAGRQLIDSARRTLTELGMRHALLEVDQFAGIVELVADDPASAEPHLRRAYNGFRRMGLDADTAETAALLARACLALDRDAEADELCTESEDLAGHALKASIAWRTIRAQLLARSDAHDEARRVAEEAVAIAERTDALVDHGDACLALATVLGAAGDTAGAPAAAERAVELYQLKGAAALAEKARGILGDGEIPTAAVEPEVTLVELDNACVRAGERVVAAIDREAWDEVERLFAPEAFVESRRKIVGFTQIDLSSADWPRENRRVLETGALRVNQIVIAVRGERLALARLVIGTADNSSGAPRDEYLQLYGIDQQGQIDLQLWFDLDDIDAAMAELDAAHGRLEDAHPRARLENAASQVDQRFWRCFAARDWDAMAEILTDDFLLDDRRQVVNAGIRQGRDAEIENVKVMADVGVKYNASTAIATRGERLALRLLRFSDEGQVPEAFLTELIGVVEIDDDERMVAHVAFDPDDLDAAFAELDSRYLAGEAAAHAHTWSLVTGASVTLNRREMPAMTPEWADVDHRRVITVPPGDIITSLRAVWDLVPDLRIYVEAVHRLSNLGAVITYRAFGTSREGFDAEWRTVGLLTFDRDLINRAEFFDEADFDTAIARFEELHPQERRLENAASQVTERFLAYFAAREWDAMAEMLAEDVLRDDRRRVVGAGARRGRDAQIENMRAWANVGVTNMTPSVIATRGERLALSRARMSGEDQRPEAFHTDVIGLVEIDADERLKASVLFDPDDVDAAIEELDARYLAGEAAPYSQTWTVIAGAFAALAGHEAPPTTPDWVNTDHRRGTPLAHSDLTAIITTSWDTTPDLSSHVEAVHLLSDVGAIFTQISSGRSHEGFDAEWRMLNLLTVDGELISGCELFDEADLDAALTRFNELSRPAPVLENAASQVFERFQTHFVARDWDAVREILAEDSSIDDRRRIVNSGVLHGRDAALNLISSNADREMTKATSTVIATRGGRLALIRASFSGHDQAPEAFRTDILGVVEIDAGNRLAAHVVFDPDDIQAAFAELEARYLAGEAAAYSHTWSLLAAAYAALNRREIPATTPDWASVDHRRVTTLATDDIIAFLRSWWDLAPNLSIYVEAVHRLSNLGAVITQGANGTSREGFDAEWQTVGLLTFEGGLINRVEYFDEAELDIALARFDELSRPAPRLENAATRVYESLHAQFAARDWDGITKILADDYYQHDRRPVVGGEIRHGPGSLMEDLRAAVDLGITDATSNAIATRGECLALSHVGYSRSHEEPEAYRADLVQVIETDADERIAALVAFDIDDIDAAFAELDARYRAGDAAAFSHTWSAVASAYAALNRQELPATTTDWVNVDHRRGRAFAPGELFAFLRAAWDLTPDLRIHVEAVHRLGKLGTVVSHKAYGSSHEGFDAEWQTVGLLTFEGGLINRCEMFDEADIDSALARFDELSRPAPRLENAASRAAERAQACFAARDWAAMAEIFATDTCTDDRRRILGVGIRQGRDAAVADWQVVSDIGTKNVTSVVIATRGERLVLGRAHFSGRDQRPDAFHTEVLSIHEIAADERVVARVAFDLDDIDAAFEELDARYLAGEAAAYANTWSVVTAAFAAINRHELPATNPDYIHIDHRRVTPMAPGDLMAGLRATWNVVPELCVRIEAVHRLNDFGVVVTWVANGTSPGGFEAEWRCINVLTVGGDFLSRVEVFDEPDLDAALARFDELSRTVPQLENAAIRARARTADAFNRRDLDGFLGLYDGRYEDRRRGLRNEGAVDPKFAHGVLFEAPSSWRLESEPVAIRGPRLGLTRDRFRDTDEAGRPIAVETLTLTEVADDELIYYTVIFDPDDINGAIAELTNRWIASGEVAHPEIIEAALHSNESYNRHDWDAIATVEAGTAYVNHRQLASADPETIADHWLSIRTLASLVPDMWIEPAEILAHSSTGLVSSVVVKGTTIEGTPIELPVVTLIIFDGPQVTRMEAFDPDQRDLALARFEELNRSG